MCNSFICKKKKILPSRLETIGFSSSNWKIMVILHFFLLKRYRIRNFVRLLNCIISSISILVFYLIILFQLPNCHFHLHNMLEPWHHLQCVRGKEFSVLKLSKILIHFSTAPVHNIPFDMHISIAANAASNAIWTQKIGSHENLWILVITYSIQKLNFWKTRRSFFTNFLLTLKGDYRDEGTLAINSG